MTGIYGGAFARGIYEKSILENTTQSLGSSIQTIWFSDARTAVTSGRASTVLYNPASGTTHGSSMQSLIFRNRKLDVRGWRSALIVIAICSLTVSVATRFWASSTSQSQTVKSLEHPSVDPKRQHLNKDACRWVPSSATFSVFAPVEMETRLAPAGPLLPKHVFTDSLYNRPPPSFSFFV